MWGKTKNYPIADSFEDLADIAIESMKNSYGLHMVCGPISTGGTGNLRLNSEVMDAVILGLQREGKELFVQMPYEEGLHRLADEWREAGNTGYCTPILEVFYDAIFESGYLAEGWFVPGWEKSRGACWERNKFLGMKCEVHDLTLEEVCKYIKAEFSTKKANRLIKKLNASL